MRAIGLLTLLLVTAAPGAFACEGGAVDMIYQPAGGTFTAEVNGVPVADALEPGENFTGTRSLAPWLLEGENTVVVRTMTPSADGGLEVVLSCPGADNQALAAATFAAPGERSFAFEPPAALVMDLPYSDAVHSGDDGLVEAVEALQADFRAKDTAAIVAKYDVMIRVAAAMGQPITAERMSGMLGKMLPEADVAYLDEFEVHEAMGGRIRVVTGADRATAPIVMQGGRFRMSSGRIWAYIDGDWRVVSQ